MVRETNHFEQLRRVEGIESDPYQELSDERKEQYDDVLYALEQIKAREKDGVKIDQARKQQWIEYAERLLSEDGEAQAPREQLKNDETGFFEVKRAERVVADTPVQVVVAASENHEDAGADAAWNEWRKYLLDQRLMKPNGDLRVPSEQLHALGLDQSQIMHLSTLQRRAWARAESKIPTGESIENDPENIRQRIERFKQSLQATRDQLNRAEQQGQDAYRIRALQERLREIEQEIRSEESKLAR